MARKRHPHLKRVSTKRNASPGSPIYVGEPRDHEVDVAILDYLGDACAERSGASLEELKALAASRTVTWVNLDGVHDVEAVRTVCGAFDVHPLAIEDVLNPGTRAKVEDYGEAIFVVAKMLVPGGKPFEFDSEQISAVLGPSWVLTFQEHKGDLFDPLRKRIRVGTGRIRGMGADYLLHGVLDAIVDGYLAVLEDVDRAIDELEDWASAESDASAIRAIHVAKGDLANLRRITWPMREVSSELMRSEGRLIEAKTVPYLRDLRDHVFQVHDLIDADRERLTSSLELQLALNGNQMNEVMRLLTIVSTLFIPVTFIAGVYGMNFTRMPELGWTWGYPAALGLMGATVAGMLLWLRRRGWF